MPNIAQIINVMIVWPDPHRKAGAKVHQKGF